MYDPQPQSQPNSDTRIMKYILFFVVLIAAVALAFSWFGFITKELSKIINAFTPKFGQIFGKKKKKKKKN
jgi:hypothetical protein